jgi:signal transduction histidine kinase
MPVTDPDPAELAETLLFRIAIAAHDLRNPLNVVVALSRLLSRRDGLPEDVVRSLASMSRAAWRMNELIDTLLGFSAIRSGGSIPVSPTATDLCELTWLAIDELHGANPQRRITVNAVGDTRGSWDAARIVQVVSNLVGNALVHGKGAVDVYVEGSEHEVSLFVRNQGAPIPTDSMPTLFEPFRSAAASSHVSSGLGLGLYISKEIVLAHRGTIEVDSTAERGTVFTVRLPRRAGASSGGAM